MPITFRKFTASARLSRETTAYDTQVLFEGKPIGHCQNDGWGGMGHFTPKAEADQDLVSLAEAWARSQPILEENGEQMVIRGKPAFFEGIGDYCDHLADETLEHRQISAQVKRLLKTHVLFTCPDREPGVLQIKQAWSPALEPLLRQRHPKAIILNTMPVSEAIDAFKEEQLRQRAHQAAQPRARSMKP